MRSTNKDMADSLFYWGVAKIFKFGIRRDKLGQSFRKKEAQRGKGDGFHCGKNPKT